ncbi:UbiA prenyltransferase family protein [Aliikangiella sp. G2MR2-5]|uniref:UbiA prenyltransferase family protein n=1 Tax=Aliikangiella sp. G2MR2-5 TaxID=2788943 RepID=UPI0018AC4E49|nr:UbiA prenyltransferase family protein [Aliikangiella sp. G2MR2-5]
MNVTIKLLRPHQYLKNLFIFLPVFFAGQALHLDLILKAFIAFIAFSAAASAIYILNDYRDINEDRLHPRKKYRPLAAGTVSKRKAVFLMVTLFFTGSLLMLSVSLQALWVLLAYVLLNIAYSFKLKHIAIIDVCVIATGFVLRLFVGANATLTPLSMWIVIMTFLLALFMALAKRRDDVLIFMDTGKKMREVVAGYNLQLIDGAMMIMSSVVIVSYILYTTSSAVVERIGSPYLYLTTIFVLLGILRYMQISFVEKNSGSPTRVLLNDRFIQMSVSGWLLSYVWILYL